MESLKTKCRKAAGQSFPFLVIMLLCLSACSSHTKDIVPSAAYAPYVNAYTGGVISQNSAIRIELAHDLPVVSLNSEIKDNPFRFSPSLGGKAYWVSNSVIEFIPEEGSLKSGTFYEAVFQLGNFVEVDKNLEEFNFSFRVQERRFTLRMNPVCTTVARRMKLLLGVRYVLAMS